MSDKPKDESALCAGPEGDCEKAQPDPEESLREEFNRLVQELRATREGLRGKSGTVMSTAATYQIAVDDVQKDREGWAERARSQRHHDVLCLVLKELLLERLRDPTTKILEGKALVNDARTLADLAYPPPKAEP